MSENDDIDPLVSIPVYGRYFQRTEEIELPTEAGNWVIPNSWVHELNLDRRYRIPASFATEVVQVNQEEYMQECWEQVGAIREANEYLRLGAVGKLIGDSLKARHFDPLSDARFALITQPFHHYYIHNNGKNQESFKSRFSRSGLPPGTTSYTFKRMVSQKAGFKHEKLLRPWKIAEENNSLWRRILRYLFILLKLLLHLLVRFVDGIPDSTVWFRYSISLLYYLKVPAVNEVPRQPDRDTTGLDILGLSTDLPDILPLKSEIITVAPINIKDALRPCFNVKGDLLERLNTTIKVPWLNKKITSFDPIMISPKINLPMYKHLSERSVDLMVPGLKDLENNTAILLEENKKFIAAYMAGLSHEMSREYRLARVSNRSTRYYL